MNLDAALLEKPLLSIVAGSVTERTVGKETSGPVVVVHIALLRYSEVIEYAVNRIFNAATALFEIVRFHFSSRSLPNSIGLHTWYQSPPTGLQRKL